MSGGTSIYSMITGIGDSFEKSYESARKQAQEDEAPAIFGQLLGINAAPSAAPAPGSTLGTLGQGPAPAGNAVPVFAGGQASMRTPGNGGETEKRFIGALKDGGLTNPYGLAAVAGYAAHESGYKGNNINGSWSDPSESGAPGTSGGILSWRGDRFANMRRLTAGAQDPVVAQAKFTLTENPDLTLALQNAKSPEEANRLMADAWKFAGYNRPGGEAQARLNSTRAYLAKLGGDAPATATPGAPGVPSMVAAAPPAFAAQRPVQLAENEAQTQALEQRMGMVPAGAPAATAEADMPAPDARPAGFFVPGQGATAPATPVAAPVAPAAPQGFAGFGTGASRMSPEQASALQAAWKNPVTRPMATQIYGELMKGQASPWKLQQMGDQPVLFNERTAQIVPVGQGKPSTATVGNTVIDLSTGQPIYSAPEKPQVVGGALVGSDGRVIYEGKEDKFTYQAMPGVGMVALHPTDPDKSRVIIAGQQPRPFTADERKAWGVPDNLAGGMGADGKPFGIGGGKTEVNVDTKGAGKFAEKASEIQAKRYGEMVDAADNAVPLRADIDTMASLAQDFASGKLAQTRLGLAQYAKAAGMDDVATKLAGGKMESMEAFTALADKLVPRMRVPGSGSTSDAEGKSFRNSLPSLLKTREGNAIIADTFRGLADYQAQAGEIAGKALRQEISQSEADQAIRALPSPFTRFKEYRSGQGGAPAGSTATPASGAPSPAPVAKGAERVALPGGYTAARALSDAKAAVAGGKDKAVIAERLRAYGIDPKRLDD
ncbi:hypothetical protein [Methylobacterium sp. Leaf111]|uniref:hypothetical protein n=1 Tax=Methylobacterium sp. Leaf111 TaxID=1736257 RepID=UPI000AC30811|nr:hypothetical protein [Methylobacterium sp. Leaf111]